MPKPKRPSKKARRAIAWNSPRAIVARNMEEGLANVPHSSGTMHGVIHRAAQKSPFSIAHVPIGRGNYSKVKIGATILVPNAETNRTKIITPRHKPKKRWSQD